MKKKILIIIGVIILVILLFPIKMQYKDGGTVVYKSFTYTITKHHSLCNCNYYKKGTTIKILNQIVYENITDFDICNEVEVTNERILKLNDKLYYDTGKKIEVGRCGVGIEQINNFVSVNEIPKENNQTNFSGDIKYQIMNDAWVDVWINNAWYVFEAKDNVIKEKLLVEKITEEENDTYTLLLKNPANLLDILEIKVDNLLTFNSAYLPIEMKEGSIYEFTFMVNNELKTIDKAKFMYCQEIVD